MISKKFVTSSIIYSFSSALSTVASFLLLPFYTNAGLLKVADFGALSLYIGLSLLVQVFTNLSIDYYVSVVYHEWKDDPEKLKAKIASLNGYIIAAGIFIALIFVAAGNLVIDNFVSNPNPSSFRYVMMSVFTGIFMAHFKFYSSLLINREKPWRYLWINIFNFVTTVAFSIIVLKMYPLTLEGPLWGRFLSCGCIFIWSFADITVTYGIAFSRQFLKPTLQFCMPVLLTAVFQWVLSYSDRYIIKPLLHNKELAVFDLAVRFTLLVNFLIDGVNSAITPKVFGLIKEPENDKNNRELNKYYNSFNLVTLLLIPLNIAVLPLVLPFFISDEKYLTAFVYFGIICAGFATRGITSVYTYPILFYKKTSILIITNGIAAVLQIALGYVMVKHFKLYGAAFTLIAVKVLLVVLTIAFSRNLAVRKYNPVKMIVLPLIVLAVICISEMFIPAYGAQMHIIHFAELTAVFGISFFVYRNELFDLVKWGIKTFTSRFPS